MSLLSPIALVGLAKVTIAELKTLQESCTSFSRRPFLHRVAHTKLVTVHFCAKFITGNVSELPVSLHIFHGVYKYVATGIIITVFILIIIIFTTAPSLQRSCVGCSTGAVLRMLRLLPFKICCNFSASNVRAPIEHSFRINE